MNEMYMRYKVMDNGTHLDPGGPKIVVSPQFIGTHIQLYVMSQCIMITIFPRKTLMRLTGTGGRSTLMIHKHQWGMKLLHM